jgi:hypothetical protein
MGCTENQRRSRGNRCAERKGSTTARQSIRVLVERGRSTPA